MARRFYTLDVFTKTPLHGNPLAVVLDSQGLDTGQMQAIARELNLSETVFVLPPVDPVHTAAMRIFTPGLELPFAGHPTVGTAILLAQLEAADAMRGSGGIVIALEQKIGVVKADASFSEKHGARAVFTAPKLSERLPYQLDVTLVAEALGLDAGDIGFEDHQLSVWSAGVAYAMVPVKSLAAIGKANVADMQAFREAFAVTGRDSVYVYTKETASAAHHVHARMFAPGMGLGEDPATGSAAAAFAGLAVAFEKPKDGTHQLVIEQGYEMGRPSEIALDIVVEGGKLSSARIGGGAVIISEGKLHL